MQKPRFRTTQKAAWVFINTRLHPTKPATISRRTAERCGYFTAAARLLNVQEKDLPTPLAGEPMSRYLARVREKKATR